MPAIAMPAVAPHAVAMPEWYRDPVSIPDPPDGLAADLVPAVLAAAPTVAIRIPGTPAAALGRLAAPPAPGAVPTFGRSDAVDPAVTERLLGALELHLDDLAVTAPAGLAAHLRVDRPTHVATLSSSGEGEAVAALRLVDQFAPGLRDLVAGLVRDLADRPDVVVAPVDGVPDSIAAAHGRSHLAVAVAVALVVLREARVPLAGSGAPAVVGLAVDAASRVLLDRPMPPAYEPAVRAERRAGYLLPRGSSGSVRVSGHRFALVEGTFPAEVGEPANGLVTAVPGGLVVRTGCVDGSVSVLLQVLENAPEYVDLAGWHEIVDIGYDATAGWASVIGPDGTGDPNLQEQTPPWPGPIRARVHARDRGGPRERYEITVWSAPLAPETVHRATDGLGHWLRGEPEPAVRVRPEAAYDWIREGMLSMAATVTVVTGASAEEVLDAFGADPAEPAAYEELIEQFGIDPWVTVLPADGAVLAVEFNGWQGAEGPVLRAASRAGRAASMFWNVNAVTRLSFARDGRVLASFEPPPQEPVDDEEARAALDGLDIEDSHDRTEKGLVAVERFTGRGITPDDLARIETAGVAYRILPRLPEHYAEERLPDGTRRWPGHGPLDTDTDLLVTWADDALRDLAWWAAEEAAGYAGLAEDPDVRATLDARALTGPAERRTRASGLEGGRHHQTWMALHEAGNPDPLGAAIHTIDKARWAAGPAAADLLDAVRARLRG